MNMYSSLGMGIRMSIDIGCPRRFFLMTQWLLLTIQKRRHQG